MLERDRDSREDRDSDSTAERQPQSGDEGVISGSHPDDDEDGSKNAEGVISPSNTAADAEGEDTSRTRRR